MRFTSSLAAAVTLLGTSIIPVFATTCAEQIGTIERRLDSAGAVQVVALRNGHTLRDSGSSKALAQAPTGELSDPSHMPSTARIADAHGLITRAIAEDRAGQQRACEDTMTEAKAMIGALP